MYKASDLLPALHNEQPANLHTESEIAIDQPFAQSLMAEWSAVLSEGPGIIVIHEAFPNTPSDGSKNQTLDHASNLFNDLIEIEKTQFDDQGDHFAKPGANDRVWNALEKHCAANPDNFIDYYKNSLLNLKTSPNLTQTFHIFKKKTYYLSTKLELLTLSFKLSSI